MKNIVIEVPESKMNIISVFHKDLEKPIKKYHLENYINITGFQKHPEVYLKNVSLHI